MITYLRQKLLRRVTSWLQVEVRKTAMEECQKLRGQLAALQAIDVNFKETGKIILIAHYPRRDTVKISSIDPNQTLRDFKALSAELEALLGVDARFTDFPRPYHWRDVSV